MNNTHTYNTLKTDIREISINKIFSYLFLLFCFIPFLFPNPIATTNVQPYASILAIAVLLLNWNKTVNFNKNVFNILVPTFTLIAAIAMLITSGIGVESLRGLYNYFALFIIPFAVVVAFNNIGQFPEKFVKIMILMWFVVASIQFFIYRGFATQIISGVKWSLDYRGVVGLASEPSFLGIVCFYFLHLIRRFKTKKALYMILTLIMGILYAQSAMGIIFIIGYLLVFMFERGVLIWVLSLLAVGIFMYIFTTKMTETRLYVLYEDFMNEGMESVLEDGSVENRYDAILNAFKSVVDNYFLPQGFGSRVGSAFGGMLVELGFLAFPAIIYICKSFATTFTKKSSAVLYFIIIMFIYINNTQIGNPMLLLVFGTNIWFANQNRKQLIMG